MTMLIENKLDLMLEQISKIIPYDFGTFGYDDIEYDLDANILAVARKFFPDIKSRHGVSKYVLITDALPYVIKIPFSGVWEYDEEEEEDFYFTPFECANNLHQDDDRRSSWNYCEDEYCKYKMVLKEHLENFFAKTELYKEINEIQFYIQEKATTFSDYQEIVFNEDVLDSYNNDLEELRYLTSDSWVSEAINYYGVIAVKAFLNFITKWSFDSDLHQQNFGFSTDGHPVLIDWSGFRD